MYKNQLQELAQRSCFNLPSYACIREGPDHAPRFRASVNFNGEVFEGPCYSSTLRQAEHAAAEVALSNLSSKGPSKSLAARVLDETGVYKNLLQETAHRAGLRLPVYTTVRSGPGHQPVFTCSVELAGMAFAGEPAKTKKQAEKNAAMAAWSALKQMPNLESLSHQAREAESSEEQEQVVVARVLSGCRTKEESRPMGQRERHLHQQQQQQRRRMLVNYRQGNSSTSFSNSPRFHRQWRHSDSSFDASPSMYSAQHYQRQSSLPRALPPPSGSKILPPALPSLQHSPPTPQEPSSSKDKSNSSSFFYSSSSTSPMEEHQKNEEGVSKLISDAIGRAIPYLRVIPPQTTSGLTARMPDQRAQQARISTRPFSPPPIGAAPMRNLPAMPIPGMMSSGGFHRSGLAPAVHMRSVIPVCATPPLRPPSNTTKAVSSKKEAEEEVSAATTSMLNKIPGMMGSGGFHRSGLAPAVHIRSVIPVCAAPPVRPLSNTKVRSKKEAEEEVSAATSMLNKIQL